MVSVCKACACAVVVVGVASAAVAAVIWSKRTADEVVPCSKDGEDYSYSETLSATTRKLVTNHCPNHPTYSVNPNAAINHQETYEMPLKPMYNPNQQITLTNVGGVTGVARSGAMIFSAYAGSVAFTSLETSAPYLEGDTFDQCDGHSNVATSSRASAMPWLPHEAKTRHMLPLGG